MGQIACASPAGRSVRLRCIVQRMDSSTHNMPLDLLKLYKSSETNRYSTFGDFADQLVPADLVAAYRHTRNSAPRRHDHDKSYFVDHSERTNRAEKSNRREEHLALALWRASRTAAPITLPDGRDLEILDYQMPLKARQKDKGVGKLDLFGLINDRRATVIELKVVPTTGRGDTPLRAYLEALAYCAIVEANVVDIANDANSQYGKAVEIKPPGLVVMAPIDYWVGYRTGLKSGQWWPVLRGFAKEIDDLLSIETHFLALENATFQMGSIDQAPQLTGDCSVVGVADLFCN